MIGEQRGRKIRMKSYCLFDSKHTWDCDVCKSDLASNAEIFVCFFSLSLPDLHR